jgi:ribosomal protein RSM22 (predicted rRNA methylase)
MLGLEEFDAFEICRLTQGRMAGTQKWIRFHDDTRLLRMTEDGDLYDANNLTKREDEDYEYLFKDMRSRVKSV